MIQKAHSSCISNKIALDLEKDEKDNNENVNPKVNFVSGAHDKYLKYWGQAKIWLILSNIFYLKNNQKYFRKKYNYM